MIKHALCCCQLTGPLHGDGTQLKRPCDPLNTTLRSSVTSLDRHTSSSVIYFGDIYYLYKCVCIYMCMHTCIGQTIKAQVITSHRGACYLASDLGATKVIGLLVQFESVPLTGLAPCSAMDCALLSSGDRGLQFAADLAPP